MHEVYSPREWAVKGVRMKDEGVNRDRTTLSVDGHG